MALVSCCLQTTSWTMLEYDLEFKVKRGSDTENPDNTSNPVHPSNTYPGTSWQWTYSERRPGNEVTISSLKKVAAYLEDGPSSSGGCINTCGSTPGVSTPVGDPTTSPGFLYEVTYQGYWRLISGSGPSLIRGQHKLMLKRYFIRKKRNQQYSNMHLCGKACPPCDGIKEFDDTAKIENQWNTWTPKI